MEQKIIFFHLGHGLIPSLRKIGASEVPIDIDTLYGVRMYVYYNGQVDATNGPGFQLRPGAGKNSLTYGDDYRSTVAGEKFLNLYNI